MCHHPCPRMTCWGVDKSQIWSHVCKQTHHLTMMKLIKNPWLFYSSRNIYVITARCADVILGPESFWQPEGNDQKKQGSWSVAMLTEWWKFPKELEQLQQSSQKCFSTYGTTHEQMLHSFALADLLAIRQELIKGTWCLFCSCVFIVFPVGWMLVSKTGATPI